MDDARVRTAENRIGLRIGNYVLERVLGQGRMGVVYAARDEALLRPTAVKVLSWDLNDTFGQDPVEWFLAEARHVARINHPRVVQIYAVGKQGGNCYIAMEFVDGASAEGLIAQDGPLSLEKAVRVLIDVATALQAAHDAGVIHRDVKPANVLVANADKRAKLGDFGMALSNRTKAEGKGMLRAGTPYYTAPENWQGQMANERSDIYALGATFYYLLTGRPPFPATSTAAVREMHLFSDIPDPRHLRPEVPRSMVALIRRAMAKEPHLRFESAESVALEGRAVLREVLSRSRVRLPLDVGELSKTASLSDRRFRAAVGLFRETLGFARQPFSDVDPLALPFAADPYVSTIAAVESRLAASPITMAVVGDAGTGRSTVISAVRARLRAARSVLMVEQSSQAVAGHLSRELGLALGASRTSLEGVIAQLPVVCEDATSEQGCPIVVVDEVSLGTLEEMSEIAALGRRQRSFSVLICANSSLADKMSYTVDEQFQIPRLSSLQAMCYIQAWIDAAKDASSPPLIFSPDAKLLLAHRSQGILSNLNLLATNALVLAASANRRVVTSFEAWHASETEKWIDEDGSVRSGLPNRPRAWPTTDVWETLQRLRTGARQIKASPQGSTIT